MIIYYHLNPKDMLLNDLLTRLNSKDDLMDAVSMLDIIAIDNQSTPHHDSWTISVTRANRVELCQVELGTQAFTVENLIHGEMEVNSYYLPPYQGLGYTVTALLELEFERFKGMLK